MKHLVLASALLLAAPLAAQEPPKQPPPPSQEDLKARYQEKLEKPFVSAGGWITDYDRARELAAKEKKFLFVYFTRSYAK